MMKRIIYTSILLMLSACAITPEQRAEQERQQKLYEQNLQVSLAAQCDQSTAELIHQQFNQPINWTASDKKTFQLKYIEKVSDPMFQACYKMAWQNHISQERLREVRHWHDSWHYGRPFYPYWW